MLKLGKSQSDGHDDNDLIDVMNMDGKESNQLLVADVSDPNDLSLNKSSTSSLSFSSGSNNDSHRHEAGDMSVESDLKWNPTETNLSSDKATVVKKPGRKSRVPINSKSTESGKMETDTVDSAKAGGDSKQSRKMQVTAPNKSGDVRTSSDRSSHAPITYSICEAVKLKKKATTPIKGHNGVTQSGGTCVAGKKRTAEEAGLDDSLSDISQDQEASSQSQSPSKSTLKQVLTQSGSSTPTTTKRGSPKTKTKRKMPAKKPALPRAGTFYGMI